MDKEDEKQSKIRELAHQIWEQEGRPDGQDQAHWERATKEIEEDQAIQPPAAVPTPQRPA